MITDQLDPVIHAPARLAIMAILATLEWAEFKFLREETGLSDSALSKQLSTLESAGYIEIRKWFLGRRPRTSARLSKAGRAAFDAHVAALRALVDRPGAPTP